MEPLTADEVRARVRQAARRGVEFRVGGDLRNRARYQLERVWRQLDTRDKLRRDDLLELRATVDELIGVGAVAQPPSAVTR